VNVDTRCDFGDRQWRERLLPLRATVMRRHGQGNEHPKDRAHATQCPLDGS